MRCTDERPCIPCFTNNGKCEDSQRELKMRLQLKFTKIKIEEIVKENFGVCPQGDKFFNDLMIKEREVLELTKLSFPKLYEAHCKKYY